MVKGSAIVISVVGLFFATKKGLFEKPSCHIATAAGFEPATGCLEGSCSIRLSYAAIAGRGSRIRTCDFLVPNQAR